MKSGCGSGFRRNLLQSEGQNRVHRFLFKRPPLPTPTQFRLKLRQRIPAQKAARRNCGAATDASTPQDGSETIGPPNPLGHRTAANTRHHLPVKLSVPDLTDEKFQGLCEEYEDYRLEYTAEGELLIMPPTDPETGARNAMLICQLTNWSIANGLGVVTDSSGGFVLPVQFDRLDRDLQLHQVAQASQSAPRPAQNVGRNAPCPCGVPSNTNAVAATPLSSLISFGPL